MPDRTVGINITILESQGFWINKHIKKTKNFRSVSAFFQHIINDYRNRNKKAMAKNAMLMIVYPAIIAGMMWYVSNSTFKANNILMEKGYYLNELYLNANTYFVMGVAWIGILLAGIILFVALLRKK